MLINIGSHYPAVAVRRQTSHFVRAYVHTGQGALSGEHYIDWYSCYALCVVIIPGISTFSQNKACPFKYLINIETSKFICIKTNQIKKRGRGRLYLWRSWRKTSPQDSKCISESEIWNGELWSHPLSEHSADYKCYESNPGEEMILSGRLVAVHFDSQ